MKKEDFLLFLTEDLKDTSVHLRETDRKLSTWTQIYGGSIVLIATLVNVAIENHLQITPDQVFFAHVFFTAFTWWLFTLSLRSMETKTIYLNRMNFLRNQIHEFAPLIGHKPLEIGYWADKPDDTTKENSRKFRPSKVGLDELYPFALIVILTILAGLVPVTSQTAFGFPPQSVTFVPVGIGLLTLILLILQFMRSNAEREREKLILWRSKVDTKSKHA